MNAQQSLYCVALRVRAGRCQEIAEWTFKRERNGTKVNKWRHVKHSLKSLEGKINFGLKTKTRCKLSLQ